MATYNHPGIYIQEVPSTRSIQGASTSTPVFIGVTEFGPTEQPTLITSWNAYQAAFGNLAWYAMVSWSVYEFFNEGGTVCWVVRCVDTAAAKAATATLSSLIVNAVTLGTWGNSIGVMISNGSTPLTTGGTTPVFNVSITVDQSKIGISSTAAPTAVGMPNALLQQYVLQNNLQVVSGQTYYVLESFNGFTANSLVGDAGAYSPIATKINNNSMFIRIPANAKAVTSTTTARPANTATPSLLKSGTSPLYNFSSATALLQKVQGISLLSVPDITTYEKTGDANPLMTQGTLINQELLFCEGSQQRNLFYVIDPPFGLDVQGILSFKTGQGSSTSGNPNALSSDFGAIYYPWVYIYNPIASANVPIPPSGPTLGRYAYTDSNVGVWKSPAGVNDGALLTAVLLDESITDSDQDLLNPEGINAIRNFINYGNVIWGARTLALNTEWTYVSIRRLFIYVEQSLKQSLQWVVFEPNDQTTWSSVTRDITSFLTTLWQQGGLFGTTATDAFFVTCDASNNPPNTRALGQLFIDIGLAPVYPAEFVILRMTQKTAAPDSGN